jgi:hypothetical protein
MAFWIAGDVFGQEHLDRLVSSLFMTLAFGIFLGVHQDTSYRIGRKKHG